MDELDLSDLAPKLEDVDEDLYIFTENPTNGAVTNAEEKGDRMVIWLLRLKGGQRAHEACREEMERRGIEPTAYLSAYYTTRGPDEYPLSEFREEFLARMQDGKPWVFEECAGFTTKKKPLTVNRLDPLDSGPLPCDSCTHRLKVGFPYSYKGVCIGCSGKVLIGGELVTIGKPYIHYEAAKKVDG